MELQDYLADCTVRIETRAGAGTGFFIAPGLILTPAHVVEDPESGGYPLGSDIRIRYRGMLHTARLVRYASSPSPDLAVLGVEVGEHSIAYLFGPVRPDDPLFVSGFTDTGEDSVRHVFEGGEQHGSTLRLVVDSREVEWDPVMDGSPVLNLRTGGVCAVVKSSDAGAGEGTAGNGRVVATRVTEIDTLFPGPREAHDNFHQSDPRWFEASGVMGTIFAARAHTMAMREACQEPIQPILSPDSGRGAVDLMAPLEFRVLGDKGVEREPLDLEGLAERCRADRSRIMIVGASGSGRSSMLRYLGYTAAVSARNPGAAGEEALFPILVRANQLASRSGSIEDQILAAMKTSSAPVSRTILPSTFLTDLVETPGLLLLLMIDGLDEIQNSRDMADIVDLVGRIQGETAFGRRTRIVVTCRPATAEHFRYSGFDIYEIQPLDESAVRTAAGQWLGGGSDGFLEANGALLESGMLRSPLTLSIALTLYERRGGALGRRLVDLYSELVQVCSEAWNQPRLREEYGDGIVEHAGDILGFLALELLRAASVQDQTWVVGTVTRYCIQHLNATPDLAPRQAEGFLRFAQNESLFLCVSGDRLFWSHQSFQDYFAARCLTTSEHESGNAMKSIRARWFDVSRGQAPAYATAMLPETEREAVVAEILSSGRPERFDFVAKLLVDGCDLPDGIVSSFVEDLMAAAAEEREAYGTELRPSPRASFAIDLLASLAHLDSAARALSQISSGDGWPSRMKERARSA